MFERIQNMYPAGRLLQVIRLKRRRSDLAAWNLCNGMNWYLHIIKQYIDWHVAVSDYDKCSREFRVFHVRVHGVWSNEQVFILISSKWTGMEC